MHQIFLVHGMGEFEAGWSANIQEQIRRLLDSPDYKELHAGGWSGNFEFKEIVYNDVFEDWRKQWRTDSAAARQAITAAGLNDVAASRLLQAADVTSGGGFWRTHVLDVVLYRYFMPVTEAVCTRIERQILAHLQSFKPAPPSYTIIAHSLGSAAVYETLHAMLTGPGGLHPAYRPANLVMMANVTAALWNRGGSCYPSSMRPMLPDHLGSCYHFADFSHQLDPFSNFRRFTPPDTWRQPPARPDSFTQVELAREDIQHVNVHALEHYLSHPAVHVPLLRLLTGYDDIISDAERDEAVARWRGARTPRVSAVAGDILDSLRARAAKTFEEEIDVLLDFRTRVLQAAEAGTDPLLDGESGGAA